MFKGPSNYLFNVILSMGGSVVHKYVSFEFPGSVTPIPYHFGSYDGKG